MRSQWSWMLIGVLILALAACGGDEKKTKPTPTPATTSGFAPPGGVSLNVGEVPAPDSTNSLPGCSDPDSSECPSPLVLDLDGTATGGGVTIHYPARYFNATTGAADDSFVIEITPNDRFKFQETANFQVYFVESVESALAGLTDPDTGSWSNATLTGTIAVSHDEAQTPPVNTTIGAFALADGRVIVVKLVTTQKYGWDLWSQMYESMLHTVVVAPES